MDYSFEEVMKYIQEEDVKFIRLAFRDAYGVQKNISVMPGELKKAYDDGIPINARVICRFSLLVKLPRTPSLRKRSWRSDNAFFIFLFNCMAINNLIFLSPGQFGVQPQFTLMITVFSFRYNTGIRPALNRSHKILWKDFFHQAGTVWYNSNRLRDRDFGEEQGNDRHETQYI